MQDDAPQRRHGVQAIARAAEVLRALERTPSGLSLGALATAIDLPKSTVHRIVGALAAEQLVATSPGGLVRLGPALARMGAASRHALRDDLHPILVDLRDAADETVDLAVLDGERARFVDQVLAPHRLNAVSAVGAAFPLHCTANGKALLAALPRERAADLLPDPLERCTEHTITRRDDLLAELERVRATGVAVDREEHTVGICAVAAAVLDAGGAPVAAISLPVPTPRFAGREEDLARHVRAAAAAGAARLQSG